MTAFSFLPLAVSLATPAAPAPTAAVPLFVVDRRGDGATAGAEEGSDCYSDSDSDSNEEDFCEISVTLQHSASKTAFPHRYIPPPFAVIGKCSHPSQEIPKPWLQNSANTSSSPSSSSSSRNRHPSLHDEIIALCKYLEPTDAEAAVRTQVVKRFRAAIRQRFHERQKNWWPSSVSVHPFGSTGTGVACPWSDIDLCIIETPFRGHQIPEKYNNDKGRKNIMANRLATLISTVSKISHHTPEFVRRAKMPIIKCVDRQSGTKVDISYAMHPHGVPERKQQTLRSVDVVKRLLNEIPMLRPLVVLFKHFLAIRGLNEVFLGGVGGHACVLWVAAFLLLVQQGVIPPRSNADDDGDNDAERELGDVTTDLGAAFIRFCGFFGTEFDYSLYGLKVFIDKTHSHVTLDQTDDDDGSDHASFKAAMFVKSRPDKKMRRRSFGDKSEKGPKLLHLTILDVLDHDADVTSGSNNIESVSSALRDAHRALVGDEGSDGRGWCDFKKGVVGLGRIVRVFEDRGVACEVGKVTKTSGTKRKRGASVDTYLDASPGKRKKRAGRVSLAMKETVKKLAAQEKKMQRDDGRKLSPQEKKKQKNEDEDAVKLSPQQKKKQKHDDVVLECAFNMDNDLIIPVETLPRTKVRELKLEARQFKLMTTTPAQSPEKKPKPGPETVTPSLAKQSPRVSQSGRVKKISPKMYMDGRTVKMRAEFDDNDTRFSSRRTTVNRDVDRLERWPSLGVDGRAVNRRDDGILPVASPRPRPAISRMERKTTRTKTKGAAGGARDEGVDGALRSRRLGGARSDRISKRGLSMGLNSPPRGSKVGGGGGGGGDGHVKFAGIEFATAFDDGGGSSSRYGGGARSRFMGSARSWMDKGASRPPVASVGRGGGRKGRGLDGDAFVAFAAENGYRVKI